MVVCKFFLQGYCRFGDNCKFEHQVNDTYNGNKTQHTSILWQSQLGSSQYQTPNNTTTFQKQNNSIFGLPENKPTNTSTNIDVETLIKSVVNDMTAFEHSKQWLLSCYGPFKEKPVFPGFEDYSFEEIRLGFFEAMKNGTIEQYKQYVNSLLQQAMIRIKSLQKPTPEIAEMLKVIYNTPVSQNVSNTKSLFGNISTTFNQNTVASPNTSIFAQGNQNLFGKPAAQTPSFPGSSGSIFGQNQNFNQPQVNQNANQPQVNQSAFGQINTNMTSPNTGSIFGNAITSTTSNNFQTPSVFGQPQSTQSSVFNKTTNLFQEPVISTTPTMFANMNTQLVPQAPPASTANVFSNNTINPFPQQTSIFNSAAFPSNVHQQQAQQGSIFGSNQSTNSLNNSPLFQSKGNDASQHANIFLKELHLPAVDESLYSKVEELTEDDIKWFQSDNIDNIIIPEKPPTFEMCFKT